MNEYTSILSEAKNAIQQKMQQIQSAGKLSQSRKSDHTLVTEMDIFVSDLFKEIFKNHFPHLHFFSEEDHDELLFPTVMLDPIDGTNEFSKGVGECVVSLTILNSPQIADPENFGWIYNPFTGFEISSDDIPKELNSKLNEPLLCLVSRSEWNKGLYQPDEFAPAIIAPRGSVAYKLGLLAAGACDFVYSKRPKNLWDIAAGTVILDRRGIKFYSEGKEVTAFNQLIFQNDLQWRG